MAGLMIDKATGDSRTGMSLSRFDALPYVAAARP